MGVANPPPSPTQRNTETKNEGHRKQEGINKARAKEQGLTKFRLESAPKHCCRLSFGTLIVDNYRLSQGFMACYLMLPAINNAFSRFLTVCPKKLYKQTQGALQAPVPKRPSPKKTTTNPLILPSTLRVGQGTAVAACCQAKDEKQSLLHKRSSHRLEASPEGPGA